MSFLTSIIITCYNYGRFLNEAIESAWKQTVAPLEIIIMDDCSTDDTAEIGRKWERTLVVQYYRNNTNLGTPRNVDAGIRKSSGEYIVHLDADNRLRPTFLEKTQKILYERSDTGIVYTDCAVFGSIARLVSEQSTWWRNRREEDEYLIWEFFDFDRSRILTRNYIHGGSVFRRRCWEQTGGYEACLHPHRAEDYSLWYQIIMRYGWEAFYLKEPLLEYRIHSWDQRSLRQPQRP